MQLLDRVKQTEFLGREFLLWLWFRTETDRGIFDLREQGKAEVWFDGRIMLQSESDRGVDTITCAGEAAYMREARVALSEDKEITRAAVKLALGEDEFSFVLDSTWMNFSTFKAPRVMQDREADPEGLFYEKIFLIEKAVSAMDEIFAAFIELRTGSDWGDTEGPALMKWVSEGG
ncbi:MAG: hypothetical protein K9L83_02910 [Deltaproteobacteria bacterium]|nr:hypothetical protein [Deltaproteobacteria bacterium]